VSLGVLLDYAYWRTDGAPLRDLGVVGVIRYLSDDPANPKNAQVPEIKALHGHRIGVVPIYEQRSTDALGGAPRGTAAGKAAVRMLRAEGWPPGTVCAVAVDTDVTTATMEKSVAFVEAFEAVLAGQAYDTGVYGEADLIDALFARGIASHLYIQTEAWSGGRLSEPTSGRSSATGSTRASSAARQRRTRTGPRAGGRCPCGSLTHPRPTPSSPRR